MVYDDTRIQYDQSDVLYNGSFAITISETVTLSEVINKSLRTTIAEVLTMSETLPRTIKHTFEDLVTMSETQIRKIGFTISETITMSEDLYRKLRLTIAETITMSESIFRTFRLTIIDVATMTDTVIPNILERIRNAIGIIKQFVTVGWKKDQVSVDQIGISTREQLNATEWTYDEPTLLYDSSITCYNNYIASEKPQFKVGKQSNPVSVSNQADKPQIGKL